MLEAQGAVEFTAPSSANSTMALTFAPTGFACVPMSYVPVGSTRIVSTSSLVLTFVANWSVPSTRIVWIASTLLAFGIG